jgi:hypothetical protein
MRLDVYNPSGTPSGTETNDVKRSGNVRPHRSRHMGPGHEAASGPWLQERPTVSPMGQLMRELHGIKNDDPAAFAQVTATISEQLHALATEESTESPERLVAMAERFERASQQGDLSPLRSEQQPYGMVLRGPWAYRQSTELQEVRADVQAVISRVLDEYANASSVSPTQHSSQSNTDTQLSHPGSEG